MVVSKICILTLETESRFPIGASQVKFEAADVTLIPAAAELAKRHSKTPPKRMGGHGYNAVSCGSYDDSA
jgi:hypothetical protein